MLLNQARLAVGGWGRVSPSFCPDCAEPLLARWGDIVTRHWAHFPSHGRRWPR
jgi:hypothetical protein